MPTSQPLARLTLLAAMVASCVLGGPLAADDRLPCLAPEEGSPFEVEGTGAGRVRGVALGQGPRAIVFSNTAAGSPCDWIGISRELVARGFMVALWSYAGPPGLGQAAELRAVVGETTRRGAEKVILAGGSRGGCLSLVVATEPELPVAGLVILSCAAVFNRADPVPTAPWAARLRVPLLHLYGEKDAIPTPDEVRGEFALFPAVDKKLRLFPESAAHGAALLTDATTGAEAREELLRFVARILP
jgi:pimeloyl-ACP methyl ester carboxylesterase